MGIIKLPSVVIKVKRVLKKQTMFVLAEEDQSHVPKGHVPVYVGELQKKRFVVPVWCVNHPLFIDLLSLAEEENGFDHPMGGLTIPCREDTFINFISRLPNV